MLLIQLRQLLFEKQTQRFFSLLLDFHMLLSCDESVGELLLHFVELLLAFDQACDVIDEVVFGTFEIDVLSSEGVVDVCQVTFGLQTHQAVSFIIKFE